MQRLINLMAVSSFIVSSAMVAGGYYVYQNKDVLIQKLKDAAEKEIKSLVSSSFYSNGVTDKDLGVDVKPPTSLPVSPF